MVVAHVGLSHEAASGAAKAARRVAPAAEDFSAAVARAERAAPGGGTGAAKDVVKEAGKDAAGGVAKLSAPRTAPSPHEDEIPKWLQKRKVAPAADAAETAPAPAVALTVGLPVAPAAAVVVHAAARVTEDAGPRRAARENAAAIVATASGGKLAAASETAAAVPATAGAPAAAPAASVPVAAGSTAAPARGVVAAAETPQAAPRAVAQAALQAAAQAVPAAGANGPGNAPAAARAPVAGARAVRGAARDVAVKLAAAAPAAAPAPAVRAAAPGNGLAGPGGWVVQDAGRPAAWGLSPAATGAAAVAGAPAGPAAAENAAPPAPAPAAVVGGETAKMAAGLAAAVTAMTREGKTALSLKLDPPALGTMSIHLAVGNDSKVNVLLVAAVPQTAQAFAAGADNLRQAFVNAGIDLGQLNVGGGKADSQSGQPSFGQTPTDEPRREVAPALADGVRAIA